MATFNGPGGVAADTRKFGPPTFIFRPGGVAEGNVYTDFDLLYADLLEVPGHKVIVLDDTGVASVSIPGNVYDLTDCEITNGKISGEADRLHQTDVFWDPATELRDVARWENVLFRVNGGGAGSPIIYTKDRSVTMVGSQFIGLSSPDPIVLSVPAGPPIVLYWTMENSMLGYVAGTPGGGMGIALANDVVLSLSGAGDEISFLLKSSSVQRNTVDGGASDTIDGIFVDGASYFIAVQSGFAGSVATIPSGASAVQFDPTSMTNTFNVQVQGALEDLDTALPTNVEATFVTGSADLAPATVITNPYAGDYSQIVHFRLRVVAYADYPVSPPAVDDTACWVVEGVIVREQSTDTVLFPTPPIITPLYNSNPVDWDLAVAADDGTKTLKITGTVTGFGLGPGTAPPANFVGKLELTPAGPL